MHHRRDAKGQRGPDEEALMGTPIADPNRPIEIQRTIHSLIPAWPAASMFLTHWERVTSVKLR